MRKRPSSESGWWRRETLPKKLRKQPDEKGTPNTISDGICTLKMDIKMQGD
jgi:hypothetical protein